MSFHPRMISEVWLQGVGVIGLVAPSHKQAEPPELGSVSCWPHCPIQKKSHCHSFVTGQSLSTSHGMHKIVEQHIYNNLTNLRFQEPLGIKYGDLGSETDCIFV